ncbi:MAG: hypothetical protein IH963_04280 [Chloroflexi bacterium]|nr:hypothetical protein [Chloroflexota bacterium]
MDRIGFVHYSYTVKPSRLKGKIMQTLRDYIGREIRLTEERIAHILDRHPEIFAFTHTIAETLEAPDSVEPDEDDPEVWKYIDGTLKLTTATNGW